MKKMYFIIVLLLVSIQIFSYSFGGGIYLGSPTGFRIKLNPNRYNSLNTTLAWNYTNTTTYISLDYTYNFYRKVKGEHSTVPYFLYTGPGVRMLLANSSVNKFGIKFTGGIGYSFHDLPLELFLEFSPILDIFPATQLDLNAGIGFVFYFL